ncbi:MAG: AAA family ATPase, partial [Desulfobacteraceae bacterium]
MKRLAERYLIQWLQSKRRKPLVLRGARQVGKSTLVRRFADQQKLILNEINLERHPDLDTVF